MSDTKVDRRGLMASVAMGVGLAASYGLLAVKGMLFLLPDGSKVRTRKLFVGALSRFQTGQTETIQDLQGNEILVQRTETGMVAYSSSCPHLGCRVRWEEEENRFFCPCHNGVFAPDGTAVSGPPADSGQRLAEVPLEVDADAGVVYIEVKDTQRRRA